MSKSIEKHHNCITSSLIVFHDGMHTSHPSHTHTHTFDGCVDTSTESHLDKNLKSQNTKATLEFQERIDRSIVVNCQSSVIY